MQIVKSMNITNKHGLDLKKQDLTMKTATNKQYGIFTPADSISNLGSTTNNMRKTHFPRCNSNTNTRHSELNYFNIEDKELLERKISHGENIYNF